MKLYFAGPLFCNAEKEFNKKLTKQIEKLGYEVFLPQGDGAIIDKEPYINMSNSEKAKVIFEIDKKEMFKSDIFLFVLDGRIPDEGACVALGMVYMHKNLINKNRILIGLQTDKRAAYLYSKLNPMIEASMDYIVESVPELLKFLKEKIINK
ncbi:nucleoside 2-deoxyribosyltransferase domain-containing protein [Clostridium aestuarii]|uniref:Nucleoside 2-deoxyribosyltransferase domain-containing protein n=1 Tax=Clostridium aestuarii TaxID=338193 RepID=A0ABT4D1S3_9CLOT|nr:nucleoside 2-deoxyribosyltransferase domain-containing protein [Clostridium aestuarii]MCY6484105.1 nucleoside 2-deoxyribosyltransferase domain-containing protein [Clostridium aestuarii]